MHRIALLLVLATLTACDMPPGLKLRDEYTGVRVLEPNLTVQQVDHDENGNAILRPARRPAADWPTVTTGR